VPLPARALLNAVIASLPASSRRLDTLALNAASTRLGLPPKRDTEWRASMGVQSGPHVGLPPAPNVVLHGVPRGNVVGPAPPLAACAPPIEHRVENGAPRMLARAAGYSGPWQQRLAPLPCVIAQICRIRETCHACTVQALPPSVPPFQTVSKPYGSTMRCVGDREPRASQARAGHRPWER
jgi:hypothetical protein